MRYLLLFICISVAAFGQKALPIRTTDAPEDPQSRFFSEGMPIYAAYSTRNGSWTSGTGFYSGNPTPGTAWYVENVSLSADTSLSASLQFSYVNIVPTGKVSPLWTVVFPKTGGAQNFPYNRLIYENTAINVTAQSAGGGTNSRVRGGVIATKVSSDFNKRADKVLMKIGDSILDGFNTDATGEDMYDRLLLDTLATLTNKSWRVVNKCLTGATSSNMEVARQNGQFAPRQVDLILYVMGMNDPDATTYTASLSKLIKWKKRTWPNAVLLICGPTPGRDAAKEAVLAAIRTSAQTLVASQPVNSLIYYTNLGAAWNYATQQLTYTTDDTHPNLLGHRQIYNVARLGLAPALISYLRQ